MNIKKKFELVPKDTKCYFTLEVCKDGDNFILKSWSGEITLDKAQLEALKFLLNTEF